MADFLSVAIIVAVARGIQVVMNNGMITGTSFIGVKRVFMAFRKVSLLF